MLQVITANRSLVLCADSRTDMEEWMAALRAAAAGEPEIVTVRSKFIISLCARICQLLCVCTPQAFYPEWRSTWPLLVDNAINSPDKGYVLYLGETPESAYFIRKSLLRAILRREMKSFWAKGSRSDEPCWRARAAPQLNRERCTMSWILKAET